jgi:hypothetical protein
MQMGKALFLCRAYKIRSTEIFYLSVCITTGTREFNPLTTSSCSWHLISVRDALMEECVRMMQQSLRSSPTTKRAKSVYNQRNLGTIKERKKEKAGEKEKEVTNGETIIRILRMRFVF